ncbi:UDP-N-acetylmuramoyl-tripeptide--D-alanyl-D-alanine ligase [soil metagenome]
MITIEELYSIFLQHPVVCTDTRKLSFGSLFFALKGDNFNGNKFAVQALQEGAAYAIIDEPQTADERILLVPDVLKAMQDLSTFHRRKLGLPVLAITGSNGKTTTKELTAAVLNRKYATYFTAGNLNNHIGVPLTLLALNKSHELAVVEMGANHQREIAALCEIAEPDFGLITNIGKAHLEGFGGVEGVKKGKGELYACIRERNGLIFIHQDDEVLMEVLKAYSPTVSYGSSSACEYQGRALMKGEFLSVEITVPFQVTIDTQLTGDYNFANVMAAVAIGGHLNVPAAEIKAGIENYAPGNQRSQVIRKGNVSIVMDAYNANPSSMMAALHNFDTAFSGSKIVALGEMRELGEEGPEEHARIAEIAKNMQDAALIFVGPCFEKYAETAGAHYFPDSTAAMTWLKSHLPQECTLLIKGSRGSKMEKLLEAF